jgi:FKBP-type peptidyl-prolyl cis-trans isomerase
MKPHWGMAVGLGFGLLAGATVAEEPAKPAAPSESILKSPKEKLSYTLGQNIGKTFKAQGIEIDLDVFLRGIKDASGTEPGLLTEEEMRAVLMSLQQELSTRQAEKAKVLSEKNKKEGEAFLEANKTKEGVKTTESGLQYKILKAGDGKTPKAEDSVTVHYRGTLIDGTEFDSSIKRGQPAKFQVGGVIKGWTEALQLMPAGSKWQIFVPSALAYAERGAGPLIGPNAVLIFEVELVSIP